MPAPTISAQARFMGFHGGVGVGQAIAIEVYSDGKIGAFKAYSSESYAKWYKAGKAWIQNVPGLEATNAAWTNNILQDWTADNTPRGAVGEGSEIAGLNPIGFTLVSSEFVNVPSANGTGTFLLKNFDRVSGLFSSSTPVTLVPVGTTGGGGTTPTTTPAPARSTITEWIKANLALFLFLLFLVVVLIFLAINAMNGGSKGGGKKRRRI